MTHFRTRHLKCVIMTQCVVMTRKKCVMRHENELRHCTLFGQIILQLENHLVFFMLKLGLKTTLLIS